LRVRGYVARLIMATNRFSEAERLFHEALARSAEEREAYLADICDAETARLVKELLQAHDRAFLQEPLVNPATAHDETELMPDTRIGDYVILEHLGSGGMGQVYRARNTRLGKDAAIKIAQKGLLAEGRQAARLSHPSICAVYDLIEHEGRACLIMELVRGVTLAERLKGGPLPFAATQRYALQIADALVHAHDAGVIHGDLKPANIMIDAHGQVKVLDFGVSRSIPGRDTGETTTSPHLGDAVGTLRYMPPEALRSERTDARADLWSFGVVLYQMIAGISPFDGHSPFDLSSSILRDAPPPLPPDVPAQIRRVIRKCLEKDLAKRYQTARDLRADLEVRPGTPWRWVAAAVLVIALVVVGVFMLGRSGATREGASIAVLPLESLSGGGDEYFAEGVTEVLIGDLAQVKAIRVISRQSAARYRGTQTPLSEIARTLGVDYVIKGTVTRSGSQVRVTAQLLNPFTDEHLWTHTDTRPIQDLLTVQNEIAREIARHVAVAIRPEEERRFAENREVQPEVLEAYLRGRSLWKSRSERNLKEAVDAFKKAIELDPQHAPSHAGLADTYAVMASLDIVAAREGYSAAENAALEALRLDSGLAEPHATLGRVEFSYKWNGRAAEQAFRRALEINPGYDTAHQWYAVFLATRKRSAEALNEARSAEQSNPFSPIIHWNVARTYFFQSKHRDALAAVGRALALDPEFDMAHMLAARIQVATGRLDEAETALKRIPQEQRRSEAVALGAYIAAGRGDRPAALAAVRRLEASVATQYVPLYHLAKVYAALGNADKALSYLERAENTREAQLVFVNVDPELAVLRADPRFAALAQRIGVLDAR
jgi:TolB-like protein/Tfp pilus assembly protein PilF